jgi:catechol 2,3-dioxygenase-like lactoylglutathione lyase family enzyme
MGAGVARATPLFVQSRKKVRAGEKRAGGGGTLRGMIDHLTLTVKSLAKSRAFYVKALAPLGYGITMKFDQMVGFGDKVKPYFFLKQGKKPQAPMHLAFAAKRRADVDAFHAAALRAGAKNDGSPGLRAEYHPNYYGAFVIDPDGHPIEAVCHGKR